MESKGQIVLEVKITEDIKEFLSDLSEFVTDDEIT